MVTREHALTRYPGAHFFAYGDGPELNAEVLALVRSSAKTVTCDALDGFAARGEPLPEVGRVDIATDWSGTPVVAVRTLDVYKMPFDAVTEAMIPPQAEFRDLAHWRAGYQAYLVRAGLYVPKVMMLLERFEVIEDFGND